MQNNLEVLIEKIRIQQPDIVFNEDHIRNDVLAGSTVYSNLGIKLLSVFGGLLGTLFFMIFIGRAIYDSSPALITFGTLFIFIAVVIGRTSKSILADTSLLCLCIAGFIMLGIGLEKVANDNVIALVILVISVTVLLLAKGFLMQFISMLIVNGSLFSFLLINESPNLYHVYFAYVVLIFIGLTHNESQLIASGEKVNRLYSPVRSAYLFTFIAVLAFGNYDLNGHKIEHNYISSLISILAIMLVITYVLNSLTVAKTSFKIYIYLLSVLILVPAIFAPAILGSLLIILLSYHYGHRTGFLAGILAFIYFVSRYYYDLKLSLLVKSEIMLLSGALFLAAFFVLKKYLRSYEN